VTAGLAGIRGVLLLSVFLLSCSSVSTGPTSGVLNVKLSSLHGDEGAVLFTITGGPMESVEAVSGIAYSAQLDANTLRVVVTGNLSSGTIACVRIPDVTQASRYVAAINQVATRSTYALRDPGLYSITLAP
jgi:hypothetical protein